MANALKKLGEFIFYRVDAIRTWLEARERSADRCIRGRRSAVGR